MVRSPLQKRFASALLLVTIAVQLNASGAWSALQSIPVFTPFIGVQQADAQSNGNFYVENADPKYGKTWIVVITCRNAAGQNVTYNQGGSAHTLAALVRQNIVNKGLALTQPQQAIVRSDGGTGAGFNWNENSGTIHMPTVTAVCQILGNLSDTYVSSTCRDDERSGIYPSGKCNFHSPGDNNMHRFTGTLSAPAACSDGADNDGDGLRDFPADPGCANAQDNDEYNAPAAVACNNGRDDDGDGLVDYPQDPGCTSATDPDEFNQVSCPATRVTANFEGRQGPWEDVAPNGDATPPTFVSNVQAGGTVKVVSANGTYSARLYAGQDQLPLTCDKGTISFTNNSNQTLSKVRLDSALGGVTVPNGATRAYLSHDEPGSYNYFDNSGNRDHRSPCVVTLDVTPSSCQQMQCSDGIDNDGDGLVDFPADPGCVNAQDNDESPRNIGNLDVEKVLNGTITPGQNASYTITVRNTGTVAAQNVNAYDYFLDSQDLKYVPFTFVSSTGVTCSYQSGAQQVSCPVGTVSPNQTVTMTLTFAVPSNQACSTQIRNRVDAWINGQQAGADVDDVSSNVQCLPQCRNGIDDDGDGRVDFPNDPGCVNQDDNTEGGDPACADRIDNDNDGLVDFPQDPGCVNLQDNDEFNAPTPQCRDGIDNDNDGRVDFPNDPGCVNQDDNTEGGDPACADRIDNDNDGLVDFPQDPGCVNLQDNDEFNAVNVDLSLSKTGPASVIRGQSLSYTLTVQNTSQVQATNVVVTDQIPAGLTYNDLLSYSSCAQQGSNVVCNLGTINAGQNGTFTITFDVPTIANCTNSVNVVNTASISSTQTDSNQANNTASTQLNPTRVDCPVVTPQCRDGIDNDNDGRVDFPADPGCVNQDDTTEGGDPACADRIDNDNDGLVDFPQDPGCVNLQDNDEFNAPTPQCQDGIDNDGDGATDFPNDFSCSSPTDNDETNPKAQCQDGIDNDQDGKVDFPQDPGCVNAQDNDEFNQPPQCTANNLTAFFQGNQGPWDDNPSYGDAKPPSFLGAVQPGTNFKFVSAPGYFSARLHNGNDEIPLPCSYGVISFTNDALQTLSKQMLINIPASGFVAPAGTTKAWLSFDESDPGEYYDNSGNRDSRAACQVTLSVTPVSCTAAKCSNGMDDDGDGLVDFPQDPGCVNAQDNDEYNAPTTVDLSITKSGPASVVRGQSISYSINVSNNGQAQATNVVVTDAVPAGLVYNDALSYGPCTLANNQVSCALPSINAGQTSAFTITFDTPAIANCTNAVNVVNSASVTSTQTDSNQSNNTASTQLNPTRIDCPAVTPQCRDGIDNDNDGRVDFPADPGCTGPDDNTEGGDPACSDRIDNDNDGLVDFPLDPGCVSPTDTDEFNAPLPACRDGIDNDQDGRVDMLDPGCSNPDDTNEGDDPACSDRIDNDQDGLIDFPFDPGCVSPTDTDEFNQAQTVDLSIQKAGPASVVRGQTLFYSILVGNSGTTQATNVVVSDTVPTGLVYNDALSYGPCALSGNVVSCPLGTLAQNQFGSFYIAFDTPAVQNCSQVTVTNVATISGTQTDSNSSNNTSSTQGSPTRIDCPTPLAQCQDFNDNDFDGRIDFPADPGCSSPTDNNENDEAACQDGRDNDNDGRVDYPQDPGCTGPTDTDETDPVTPPQCRDGLDNDNDGRVDMLDPGCANPDDNNEGDDPACSDRRDNDNDGLTDFPQDPGCVSPTDTDEFNAPNTQCRDGIDNDGDGRVDTNDAGCANPDDNNEGDGAADLGIVLTGPATVQGGSAATYVATISNNGPDAATSPFSIRVSIPTGVTFNAAQSSQGCTQQGTAVVCSNITLGLFQQTTRSIVFNVPGNGQQAAASINLLKLALGVETAHAQAVGGVCNTTIVIVGTIQPVQPDPNQSNNQSQVSTFVSCQALPQCQDGIDNDQDGKVDFPADPGCSSQADTDETDVAQFGCVEIKKETFDPHGNPLPIAAQFTFILDATRVAYNDASGRARFDNLTAGAHSVAEIIPSGWTQLSVSPQNGMVTVTPGTTCAQVTFRNRQVFVANAQCADGYDNDGDGATDYPQDQGCSSATDNDEYNSTFVPQCSDNVDNDGDGLKDFPQDTGCENAADNNEQNAGAPITYACSDNVDNDGDGLKDFPADTGCVSAQDTDETNAVVGTFACNDGIDNDNDGVKDYPQDTGCSSAQDTDEFNFRAARCSDGIDNDGDGLKDYPQDTGCTTAYDDNEYNDRLWLDRWREFWNWNW
jgi:uncharacterized repeat protein (TIGR01451 family)